jgi:ABC-type lipoprotein export system ATPase subunit
LFFERIIKAKLTVVIASHNPTVVARADRVVSLPGPQDFSSPLTSTNQEIL